MPQSITGGCLCGDIRYECQGEPLRSFICHCTDCQQFTGSVFAAELIFPKESVRILSGTPKGHSVTAESGNDIERQFCSRCGSGLFAILEKRPESISVQAGSIDYKAAFKPSFQVWTQSQVETIRVNDDLTKFEKSSNIS